MIPTENWPKPWMLQVHAAAVERGFIWLEGISEADAESFKLRFYRMRRRSDKSMAAFIPAEYHLVMVGRWEPGPDNNGRLPIIYNQRADGVALPAIAGATSEDMARLAAPPQLTGLKPVPIPDARSLEMQPAEIESLVDKLRKQAKERQ